MYLGQYFVNEWRFSSTFLSKVVGLDLTNNFAPAPNPPRPPLWSQNGPKVGKTEFFQVFWLYLENRLKFWVTLFGSIVALVNLNNFAPTLNSPRPLFWGKKMLQNWNKSIFSGFSPITRTIVRVLCYCLRQYRSSCYNKQLCSNIQPSSTPFWGKKCLKVKKIDFFGFFLYNSNNFRSSVILFWGIM